MYGAYGFKFRDERSACEYLNIDYEDLLRWRRENTGGWTSLEDYPKDDRITLEIKQGLVDPYEVEAKAAKNTEAEPALKYYDLAPSGAGMDITPFCLCAVTGILLVLLVTVTVVGLGLIQDQPTSENQRTALEEFVSDARYRHKSPGILLAEIEAECGDMVNIEVDNSELPGDYATQDGIIQNALYTSELIKDSDGKIVGINAKATT